MKTTATYREKEILLSAINSNIDAIHNTLRLARKADRRVHTAMTHASKHLAKAAGILEAHLILESEDDG